jgi:hypothetical protein
MGKLYYMGLEPYEGRYTLQLQQWSEAAFKRRGIDYEVIYGDILDSSKSIVTGQVLDAHGRSYYSLTQMANLVKKMKQGEVTSDDTIFFEDMFTPGIESLPYIMDQIIGYEYKPNIFVRCLAQTIDPDDFLHVWDMDEWMSHYEKMVNVFATGVLASNEEMVAHMRIAGWKVPIYNISGLAFDKQEVRSRVTNIKPFQERTKRVAFAARFDQEKQPHFFMDLVEKMAGSDIEFAVLSGGPLRSNDPAALKRARLLTDKTTNFKIYENLKKNEYYELLADSRILFNCALQDWVSNTASEADALGTNCLYPAYRSFPESFANDLECLYIPWSMDDAINKLHHLINNERKNLGKLSDWTSGTIDRCLDIMFDNNDKWYRNTKGYRNYVSASKY